MKKRFSLMALLMSVMLLLTACSSGGQVMDGAKTPENPPALHSIEYDLSKHLTMNTARMHSITRWIMRTAATT